MKQYKKLLQAGVLSIMLGSMFGCSVAGRLQRRQTTASLSQLTLPNGSSDRRITVRRS